MTFEILRPVCVDMGQVSEDIKLLELQGLQYVLQPEHTDAADDHW
jgi:hypothetical protein